MISDVLHELNQSTQSILKVNQNPQHRQDGIAVSLINLNMKNKPITEIIPTKIVGEAFSIKKYLHQKRRRRRNQNHKKSKEIPLFSLKTLNLSIFLSAYYFY